MGSDLVKAGGGRVWTIKFRAGPANTPYYHGYGVAGAVDWGQGDVTKLEVPSEVSYNQWTIVDEFQASAERATLPLTVRLTGLRSELLDLVKIRCAFDVQVHFGTCDDPRDFDKGWDKIYVYESARATNYSTTEQGAMQGGDQAGVTEEVSLSAVDLYTILRMTFKEVAKTLVSETIVAVTVCDNIACGECTSPSDGRGIVFSLSNPLGSSPGIKPQVIITRDGYANAWERYITSIAIAMSVNDGACVGSNYVAVSNGESALHYASKAGLLAQTETWTKVTTGFVALKGPNAIWSNSPFETWIVGNGGYVYFTTDPTAGVTVQDAGSATVQNLADVSGWDGNVVVAVGASNAVIYTLDGTTWQSVTGPSVAVNLTAVDVRTKDEWWVGNASGAVYYTTDRGVTWTAMTGLKGTPTAVSVIKWYNQTVGYIAAVHAGPLGKIHRTINGGKTWYIMPENSALSIPLNDQINAIDCVPGDANIIFAGGLADDAKDGILLKGSDS